jgi:dienelactone hydrolase
MQVKLKFKSAIILSLATLAAVPLAARFVSAQIAPPAPPTVRQPSTPFKTSTYTPTADDLKPLQAKLDQLNAAIDDLKKSGANDALVVDAESCAWQAHNMMTVPGGFIDQTYVAKASGVLDDGLRRAGQIKNGTAMWATFKGRINRAYRSSVDGTAQPFHISIPASYDPKTPIPLYVYMHGRSQIDPDLGEGWAGGADRAGGAGPGGGGGAEYIRIEVFGRGNNSFRWAGETDVMEAIASVQKQYNIDPNRILLAGFSMGGAGGWQIGLHNPDMFCGLEVDAGVIGNRTSFDGMTPAQRAAQATYGIMIDHAINVFNVPLVGYAGANDAQLASSTAIRKQLTQEGYTIEQTSQYVGKGKDINALFLANPGQGHSHATGATAQLINAFNAQNLKTGRVVPDHIKFVTYILRYNHDYWVTIDGMGQDFSRAFIDAQRDSGKSNYTIKTTNISRLILDDMSAAKTVSIDGDTLQVTAAPSILFVKDAKTADSHWKTASIDAATDTSGGLRKQHDLQGPNNAAADAEAKQELTRFEKLFQRDYCGTTRTKADSAVTADDIANNNLILFGDPGSNSIIAKIADKLPIKWTKETITVGDKTYSAADSIPVMIYPNPLNPKHYVVLNAGLPAGGPGGGANAYGDYAILKLNTGTAGQITTEVTAGGVFDESWNLAKN